jgi:outer membrane protein
MLRDRWLIVLLCVLGLSLPAWAQQEPLRIGVVNAARLLDEAPQAKEALRRLEEEFKPRDDALLAEQSAIRELESRLAEMSPGRLADSGRRQLEYELRSRQRDVKRTEEELREDYNFRRNDELRKLQQLIFEAIIALAKDKQFDLILNQDAVVFAGPRVDITGEVLDRLEQEP